MTWPEGRELADGVSAAADALRMFADAWVETTDEANGPMLGEESTDPPLAAPTTTTSAPNNQEIT